MAVPVVGVCALVLGVALGVLLAGRHHQSRLRRRANDVQLRLGAEASGEDPLASLVRTLEAVSQRAAEAEVDLAAFRGALDVLPLGVVVVGGDGTTIISNEWASSLLGTRHSDALAAQAVQELAQTALAGGSDSRSLDLYGPPRRTLALASSPIGELGTGGAVVVMEDVSDRKRLEAMRRDFVANVSHELKTPIGALGLLAETLASEDDLHVVRRLAEHLQEEAFRVARIIDDLLDLSRLEAESAVHEPVKVADVVEQAVDRIRAAAGYQDVNLAVDPVPPHWSVLGDRRQLVSAVHNLLDNAVKYSQAGGSVEIGADTDGRTIELVVRDFGIGIPSRDLERVFERFYRVDRGRARDTGGTGLGLAIVRHVITNHGGDVRVESREGEGSVFRMRLPAAPGPIGLSAGAEAG